MAHDTHASTLPAHETQPIGPRAGRWSMALLAVGVLSLIGGYASAMAMGGWERLGFSYLAGFAFALSICLGCLLLVLVTHLFRAGWVVVVRRVIECQAAAIVAAAVLFVPVWLFVVMGGEKSPYPWARGEAEHHSQPADHAEAPIVRIADSPSHDAGHAAHPQPSADHGEHEGATNLAYGEYGDPIAGKQAAMHHMIEWKKPFLNKGVFTLLWVVFFAIWGVLGVWYHRTSVKQDRTRDPKLTNKREAAAPLGTLLYALSITFAAFTLLMSLDPTWYSTMYGVYYFAGSMTAALSTTILALLLLRKAGVLSSVTVEHMHDLGKLLFTFVVFWTYIAYSQYMLVWYGSIPAEQPWMIIRGLSTAHENAFSDYAAFMLLGHFVLPFIFLLSRHVKRNMTTLAIGAVWMLFMQACDIFWLTLPEYQHEAFPTPLPEALCMIGCAAIVLGAAAAFAAKAAPVAHGDPRLQDSLNFRNY